MSSPPNRSGTSEQLSLRTRYGFRLEGMIG